MLHMNLLCIFALLFKTLMAHCSNETDCQCIPNSNYNSVNQRCQCEPNVSLDVNDSCLNQTLTCQYPCLACHNISDECLLCPLYYLLEGDECRSTSSSVLGQLALANTTYQCLGGCTRCTDLDACLSCAPTYTLSNGTCQPCPTGCRTCDAFGCSSCFDGAYLSGQECLKCASGCFECTSQGCIKCAQAYRDDGGTCARCGQFCKVCTATGCTECFPNYLVPANGTECIECLGECVCSQGYYDNAGSCALCNATCASCDSLFMCSSCVEGYIRSNDQDCIQPCPFPCLECSSSICSACYGGYSLQNGQCNPNTSCNSTASCTECPRGFYLEVLSCLPCPSNCERCSSATACLQCRESFFIVGQGDCAACPSECKACLSSDYCLSCESGHVMERDGSVPMGKCAPCTHHCRSCLNEPHQCLSCESGYSLSSHRCISDANIGFDLKLSLQVGQFLPRVNEFKASIMNAANIQGSPSLVVIEFIADGSTDVKGRVILEDATQAQAHYANLQSTAGSLSNFDVITVTSIEANGFSPAPQPPIVTDPQQPSQENMVGPIVGGVFGGIAVIIGIIVAYRIVTKKEESDVSESSLKETSMAKISTKKSQIQLSQMPESLDFGEQDEKPVVSYSMEPNQ